MRPAYDDPFRRGLAWAFLLVWLASAIGPADRVVWALENVLVLVTAGLIYFYRHEVELSRSSCALLFAFLCFHELGAHYTYPGVPYDAWLEAAGVTLGLERNHYDRLVHLLFGLLLADPLREVLLRTSPMRRGWSYVLPAALVMAGSSGYEMAEWLAAAGFGGDQGAAFIGAQGDEWDAQKDMALATAGAAVAMAAVALRDWRAADVFRAAQIVGEHRRGQRLVGMR